MAQIADIVKAKGTVYEYGVHVPMIIAGPSIVNKGRVSSALVNTADLFATIIENFGYTNWQTQIPTNKPVDSKSLQPIIKNLSDSVRPWIFSEIFKLITDSADAKGIRNRNYKLIKFNYGAEEFYNLETDPLETNNLLNGNLTATDIANYNYLCNEMTTLVGGSTFCQNVVGINGVDLQNELVVFPNPAKNNITVTVKKYLLKNYTIELVDLFGRTLYRQENMLPATAYLINISTLPKGLYNILIKLEGATTTKKLIIE
jgi:hypothetical protein